jgi:hypothetical protein
MNDYCYYTLICPFIDITDRTVCTRNERYFVVFKNKKQNILNSYIYLHQGSPCGRYCICRYFLKDDVLEIYEDFRKTHLKTTYKRIAPINSPTNTNIAKP